jgi:hypothetical protein
MELLDPPLPEDTKEKLLALVDIYTQEVHFSNAESFQTDPEVHTIHNLLGTSGVAQNDCVEGMDVAEDAMNSQAHCLSAAEQSHWTQCKGNACLFLVTSCRASFCLEYLDTDGRILLRTFLRKINYEDVSEVD